MKIFHASILSLFLCFGCRYSNLSPNERILNNHLILHKNAKHVREKFDELGTMAGLEKRAFIRKHLSNNTLSSFLLTTPLGKIPEEYELEFPDIASKAARAMGVYLYREGTLCSIANVSAFHSTTKNDVFSGEFRFSTPYGISGRCLFSGKGDQITEMVIAKRGSKLLKEGYAVFGCSYGKNILEEYHDQSVWLPVSSKGTRILNKLPGDINVSVQRWEISISKKSFRISDGPAWQAYLKNLAENKKDEARIFLWFDKSVSKDCTTMIINGAKQSAVPTFQVFMDTTKGRHILKAQRL